MSRLALVASAISSIIDSPVKTYDECVANGWTILPAQILDIDSIHRKSLIHVDFKDSTSIKITPSSKIEHTQIFLKPLVGDSQSMLVDPNITVLELKQAIYKKFGSDIKTMRLTFSDKQLDDNKTLTSYNIKKGCTIQVLYRALGGLNFYVIKKDLLDPLYDRDFTNLNDGRKTFIRGNELYKRPCGWDRIALNVGKYGYDKTWLGQVGHNSSYEWPVSYHGTKREFANSIADEGYRLDRGSRFRYGRGIYSTPDISIAERYAIEFYHCSTLYKVVLQNRINPVGLEKHRNNTYWLTPIEENIRPYGLCIKRLRG